MAVAVLDLVHLKMVLMVAQAVALAVAVALIQVELLRKATQAVQLVMVIMAVLLMHPLFLPVAVAVLE
jgi:hypothetical protein